MSAFSSRWVPLWVALAVLVAQIPALWGGFVWDDVPLLVASDLYTAPARLADALGHPLGMATNYWRPLVTTSFLVDAQLLGGSAAVFRGTAAVLHALVAGLLTFGVRRAGAATWLAAVAGLAFGWHPVTVEPVTWISGRFDLLAGLGAAAALVAVLVAPRPRRAACAGIAAATLVAALSKEAAFVLPLVLGAASLASGGGRSGALRVVGSSAGGIVLALALRLAVLGDLPSSPAVAGDALGGPVSRALLVGRVFAEQLRLLILPWGAVGPAHHAEVPLAATDVLGWAGLLVVIGLVGCFAVGVRSGRRDVWWLVAFGAALAPVSQVLPLDLGGELITADRFLYLPLMVATVGAAASWTREPGTAQRVFGRGRSATLGLVLLALVAYRVHRIGDWKNDRALFTRMAEMAPDSPLPWLGLYEVESREGGRTVEIAEELVQRRPTSGYTALLADAHLARGEVEEARRVLLAAPVMDPPHAEFLVMEGEQLLALGHPEEAERRYATAIQLVRGPEAARFGRLELRVLAGGAVAARRGGDRTLAHARLDAALEVARTNSGGSGRALGLLAALELDRVEHGLSLLAGGGPVRESWFIAALEAAGRAQFSVETVEQLVEYGEANEARLRNRLDAVGRGLGSVGAWERAATVYGRLVKLAPENASYRDHLGYVLFGAGDPEGAERELRRSIELDGEHAWAHYHLGLLLDRTDRADEADGAYAKARSLATLTNDRALLVLLDDVTR